MVTWDDMWEVFGPILPHMAAITSDVGGVLVGGTALAIHLEHRASFDIDVQTKSGFDTIQMGDRLQQLDACVTTASTNYVEAVLEDIRVEIWKSRHDEATIEDGPIVAGMPVASLRDLFAMKLGAVVDRKQFRDFYDVAALLKDVMGLEDGLRCYAYRYRRLLTIEEVGAVLQALQCPSDYIASDPHLDPERERVLHSLYSAAEEARHWLVGRQGPSPSRGTPPDEPRIRS